MKRLILLVLICSMIGLPVSAVDPEKKINVRIHVSAQKAESIIRGYLKRELRKIDDVRIVTYNPQWEVYVAAVRQDNGLYSIAITIMTNWNLTSILKDMTSDFLKENFATAQQYESTLIHTGYDLKAVCEDIVVVIDDKFYR